VASAASDTERPSRIADALQGAGLDAVVCALPSHVLLLSGYWPVVGTAVAVATREGGLGLIVPEDEMALARQGRATELASFAAGSLHDLRTAATAVQEPLGACLRRLGVSTGRLGFEGGEAVQGASYAAMHLYGAGMRDMLAQAAPQASLIAADVMLAGLCAILTPRERAMVAMACEIAAAMFHQAPNRIRPGVTEPGVAAWLRPLLSYLAPGPARSDGFVYCMTGAHAAQAGAAYARSRADIVVAPADTVLVHCNSYLDGFWTDITRTFSAGVPGRRLRAMYQAIFDARDAALAVLRPGARAADADLAARSVLEQCGFGSEFTHSTGHGVGFGAIDHNAIPRLHPRSGDVLEAGMVFNVEPAIYLEGVCGIRHCDVVALEASGPRVLTPFQATLDDVIVCRE
jgi:Xaa-Pro aminopeptidase